LPSWRRARARSTIHADSTDPIYARIMNRALPAILPAVLASATLATACDVGTRSHDGTGGGDGHSGLAGAGARASSGAAPSRGAGSGRGAAPSSGATSSRGASSSGAASSSGGSSGMPMPGDVIVDPATLYQKISGFGASTAWGGAMSDADAD